MNPIIQSYTKIGQRGECGDNTYYTILKHVHRLSLKDDVLHIMMV
jgi:hypothetical protein